MAEPSEVQEWVNRYEEILGAGVPLDLLQEFETLKVKMAAAVPSLLRAIKDVAAFRDELLRNSGPVETVSRAFGLEIDRALKGQR